MVDARAAVGIAGIIGAFFLGGCGGSAFVFEGDGGAGEDSGPSDAASDVGPVADGGSDGGARGACPASLPASGAQCAPAGLECEYGTSPVRSCNTVATCTAGLWTLSDKTACPVGTCPATYLGAATKACTTSGLVCSYAEGTCGCSFGGGPVQIVDGAVVSRWQCTPAQTGCPSPRPDIGTPCSSPGTSCSYAPCSGGVALTCNDGRWEDSPVACPAAAAAASN